MRKEVKPGRRYFVINIDEPYAPEIYEVPKKGQTAKGERPKGIVQMLGIHNRLNELVATLCLPFLPPHVCGYGIGFDAFMYEMRFYSENHNDDFDEFSRIYRDYVCSCNPIERFSLPLVVTEFLGKSFLLIGQRLNGVARELGGEYGEALVAFILDYIKHDGTWEDVEEYAIQLTMRPLSGEFYEARLQDKCKQHDLESDMKVACPAVKKALFGG
ncbi:MAG: hypothetical protein ACOX6M_13030 [Armatimonadota bacterium]